jgi:hypothetical protein
MSSVGIPTPELRRKSGWYRMHRGWMRSPDFRPEPFTEREAFLWSIEKAAFEPHEQWFNGRRIALKSGQLITSLRDMCEQFRWPVKRVRLFLQRMERAQKWAHAGAHGGTIITVCNYSQYQTEGHANGTPRDIPGASEGQARGTQDKNGKKEEESSVANATVVADPVKELFDLGVSILTSCGLSERQSRSLIGKYRKDRSEAEVMQALLECRSRAISEPVEWLAKRLKSAKYVSASGYEYRGDIDAVIRESERRADWSIHWRAVGDRDRQRSAH